MQALEPSMPTMELTARTHESNHRIDMWMHAHTMSCTVQDYLDLESACSAPAMVHFLHSLNWLRETKGACHLDFLLLRFAAADQDNEQAVDACNGVSDKGGKLQQKQPRRSLLCSSWWWSGCTGCCPAMPCIQPMQHSGHSWHACMQVIEAGLKSANAAIHRSYCGLGVDELLLTEPTVDDPRNID